MCLNSFSEVPQAKLPENAGKAGAGPGWSTAAGR